MDFITPAETVIQTFYASQNQEERHIAHKWLLDLQNSSDGWNVAWMLLDHLKSVEVQYYGAIILHSKLTSTSEKLDSSELNSKLLNALILYSSGTSKVVFTKLCSAYASFILRTAGHDFDLQHCLESIQKQCANKGVDSQSLVLELLTCLPIEFKQVTLTSSQKINSKHMLLQFKAVLVGMCQHVLCKNIDYNYQLNVLSCLINWIEFGVSILDASNLLPILFSKIACVPLSDKILDVLIEFVTSPASFSCENTIFSILMHINQLEDYIESAILEDNHELLKKISMLLINFGETHCSTLLKATDVLKQNNVLKLIQIILKFTSAKGIYPVDETHSELTFNFWYTLQESLLSLDVESISDYQKQFYEAFVMLVEVFLLKSQYPSDEIYQSFSADDKEQFRCYRIDIQDTMLYVYTLLQERCLALLVQKLSKLLSEASSCWQEFEAIFLILQGTSESISLDECVYIPNILLMLAHIPHHPKILDTLVLFLGSLSEWLNAHPENIKVVLPFLLKGFESTETITSCSISLKDICRECSILMDEPTKSAILQVCFNSIQVRSSKKLVSRLFEIVGYVLSGLQSTLMKEQVECFVSPLFQRLQELFKNSEVSKESGGKLVYYLNLFHALFRSIDPYEVQSVHPVSLVFGQLVQLFCWMKPWFFIEDVVKASTDCIAKSFEVVRENLLSYVPITCDILLEMFDTHPFSCILETSTIIIGMFGNDGETKEKVYTLFVMLADKVLFLIKTGESCNFPDLMQSFAVLITRVIKTVPQLLFDNDERHFKIYQSALSLLCHQETPTIKSTCNFFVSYINISSSYEKPRNLIKSAGFELLKVTLLCIGGISPRHTCDNFADVILALNKKYVTDLAIWFNELFSLPNFPTDLPSKIQKDHFQKAVLREKSNKRHIKEIVNAFSLLCRGLQITTHVP
ncbi:importin-13 isoform X1 [Hydra vulgaris]|uniref:importin-13 isoform X1 n=1 Tax=Hydra vulgaris TaxID=6087 RepID=UPI001F5EC637|nr:importin-13 [Hydra vulgaris]